MRYSVVEAKRSEVSDHQPNSNMRDRCMRASCFGQSRKPGGMGGWVGDIQEGTRGLVGKQRLRVDWPRGDAAPKGEYVGDA